MIRKIIYISVTSIAALLVLFFVFEVSFKETGTETDPVELSESKLPDITINLSAEEKVFLNEEPVSVDSLAKRLIELTAGLSFEEKASLLRVKLHVHKSVRMNLLTEVKQQMRMAGTLSLSFKSYK